MRRDRIYVAGPMRGHPLYNFAAFFEAAMVLREAGYDVVNPAEVDMADGFNPALPMEEQPNCKDMDELLREDAKLILGCDGIALLPGWEDSRGAKFERHLAQHTGVDVYLYKDGYLIPEARETEPQRLWDNLPGVKSIRLSLTDMAYGDLVDGDSASVHVDVVDSESGEQVYDFGEQTLHDGNHQVLLKLDAEVEVA